MFSFCSLFLSKCSLYVLFLFSFWYKKYKRYKYIFIPIMVTFYHNYLRKNPILFILFILFYTFLQWSVFTHIIKDNIIIYTFLILCYHNLYFSMFTKSISLGERMPSPKSQIFSVDIIQPTFRSSENQSNYMDQKNVLFWYKKMFSFVFLFLAKMFTLCSLFVLFWYKSINGIN